MFAKWLLVILASSLFPLSAAAAEFTQDNTPVHEFVRQPGDLTWTGKFKFDNADDLRQKIGLPMYRWMPDGTPPKAIVLAIHGLTLHGRSYEVLAKGFSAAGFIFVAPDMRGYGESASPSAPPEIQKIDNEKSYEDLVRLLTALNEQYPELPVAVLGESLGTSFCIRLAGEHKNMVDAIIIAAPTSRVNPLMYLAPQTIAAGLIALVSPGHKMNYKVFFNDLVSNNPAIIDELKADPLTLKKVPLGALIETQAFVGRTNKWAKLVKRDTPVLILQGSQDKAMVPRAVTRLTKNIKSTDQTIRWISGYGHLLLETDYLGPPALDAITAFINDHGASERAVRERLYAEMKRFGAKDLPVEADEQ